MFLFLQSWRATLIPALTLPVSLVAHSRSCTSLDSINTLTLFAIVLATGIVVDDAIVVIENVERHIQVQEDAAAGGVGRDARGVRRGHRDGSGPDRGLRAGGVLPGTTGRLYQQFALTIAFSVAISAFNADADAGALGAAAPPRPVAGRAFFGAIERVLHAGATSTSAASAG